jgi:hypothetical protein
LINTVVIADRLDTLQKTREVLDHPYFSQHVTRLVWDASVYDRANADSLQTYQRTLAREPWRSLAFSNCYNRMVAEQKATAAVVRGAADQSRLADQEDRFSAFIFDDSQSSRHKFPGKPAIGAHWSAMEKVSPS